MKVTGIDRQVAIDQLKEEVDSPIPPRFMDGTVDLPIERVIANRSLVSSGAQVIGSALSKNFSAALANAGIIDTELFDGAKEIIRNGQSGIAEVVTSILDPDNALDRLPQTVAAILSNPLVQQLAVQIAGAQVAAGMAQSIPVIGWVIALVVNNARMVWRAVQEDRRKWMPAFASPADFDRYRDEEAFKIGVQPALQSFSGVGNEILDWTPVFLPPGMTIFKEFVENGTIAITAGTLPEGHIFGGYAEPAWTFGKDYGVGVIPGSGLVHQGYAKRYFGGDVYDLGEFLPLVQAHGAALWQLQVVQSGPGLFGVNTKDMERLWRQYLRRFRYALTGRHPPDDGGPRYGSTTIPSIIQYPNRRECRDMLNQDRCKRADGSGWGPYGRIYNQADADRAVDFFADPARFGWADSKGRYIRIEDGAWRAFRAERGDPYGIDECVPVKAIQWLRKRQFDALDTLICAYVDDGYAALHYDQEMRLRWSLRRSQLLEHRARCRVQMDSVPTNRDGRLYYDKLVESGATHPACGLQDIKAVTDIPEGVSSPPFATGFDLGIPRPRPRPGLSTGAKVALAGAAGVAIWQREAIAEFLRGLRR